ncbi:MAG: hypothetical protein GTO23_08540 [Nitrososphaeria archaeon]|nr:hypothetical protein [Nitrososphaeria archaeon]
MDEDVVLDHLLFLPYSLKNLGGWNEYGWGLAFYNDSEPVVLRGNLSAEVDPYFDLTAELLATSHAQIGIGHVRSAASGASEIPNPHPFIRRKGGRYWAFGHNGILSKMVLRTLVGSEYLANNPPTVGEDWEGPDVVDSDLYMLYILKCIEEENWNATTGIAKATADISKADSGAMNFFLTDGETLWGFRKGNTLYYCHNETFPRYSAIASQPPDDHNAWIALHDHNLVILTIGKLPQVIQNITTIPEHRSLTLILLLVLTQLAVVTCTISRGRVMRSAQNGCFQIQMGEPSNFLSLSHSLPHSWSYHYSQYQHC